MVLLRIIYSTSMLNGICQPAAWHVISGLQHDEMAFSNSPLNVCSHIRLVTRANLLLCWFLTETSLPLNAVGASPR